MSECYFAKCHSALRTCSNTNNNSVNCAQTPSSSNPHANKTTQTNEQVMYFILQIVLFFPARLANLIFKTIVFVC